MIGLIKLLVADDEIVIRDYIRYVINEEDICIEVEEACNGKEAIKKTAIFKPDIVLLDIRMPGIDGLEVASRLRNDYPWLKIIILTAYDDFAYAHRAIQIGISHYLLKPVSPKDFLHTIKAVINEDEQNMYIDYGEKVNDYDLEHQLIENIKLNERENALKILDHLLSGEKYHIGDIKSNMIELIGIIVRSVISLDVGCQELMELKEKSQNLIFGSNSRDSLKNIFIDFVTNVMSLIENQYCSPNEKLIMKAKDFIQRNYTHKIYMNDVAGYVGLSPYYFSRIFKQEAGLSFTQYINKIRIKKSKEFIRNHTMSLGEIAEKVGYEDFSYFSRVFRKCEGCLPSEFRKKIRNK